MEMRAFEDHRTVGVAMGAVIAVDPKQNGLACPGRGVSETDRKVLAERTQDTDEHVEASGTFGCELEVETRVFHEARKTRETVFRIASSSATEAAESGEVMSASRRAS
jgi:hypothetical protein